MKKTMTINGIEKQLTENRAEMGQNMLKTYCGNYPTKLCQVYDRYSTKKHNAMIDCQNDSNGIVKIISRNVYLFSVVYISADETEIVYKTGKNSYRWKLKDIKSKTAENMIIDAYTIDEIINASDETISEISEIFENDTIRNILKNEYIPAAVFRENWKRLKTEISE